MRPYRAKPIDPKLAGEDGFVYGWYVKADFAHYIVPAKYIVNWKVFIEVIGDTVGQQVGLKDKSSKKDAYEGDIAICSCSLNPKLRYKGVIKYNAPQFYLACFWEDIDGDQRSFPVGENNRSLINGVWLIDEIIGKK